MTGIFNFCIIHVINLFLLVLSVSSFRNSRSFILPPLLVNRSFHGLPFRFISRICVGLIFTYWVKDNHDKFIFPYQ